MTTLTTAERGQLTSMRTQARIDAAAGIKSYYAIYELLADWLTVRYGVAATDSVVLWLRGATEANAGRGAFSELIRTYTDTQYRLRYATGIPPGGMQRASDGVAENLLKDLLGESSDWPTGGLVPDINRIAIGDANAVGLALFNTANDTSAPLTNSAWSGAVLFSLLGSDQTGKLTSTGASGSSIDTLNDLRDVLYAAYSYAKGLDAARNAFQAEIWGDQAAVDQALVDIEVMYTAVRAYVQSDGSTLSRASALSDTFSYGTSGAAVGVTMKLIAETGLYRFLDMVMGASLGKSLLGTTTSDASFLANAQTYFGLTPAQLQSLEVRVLPSSVSGISQLALTDVNVRAALGALSFCSVQVSPSVAARFALEGQDGGTITQQWITDRAGMVDWLSVSRGYDTLTGGITGRTITQAINYEDRKDDGSVGTHLLVGTADNQNQRVQILFGGDANDTLTGFGQSDHLYGGAGNDRLEGQGGVDYLEGGAGDDSLSGDVGDDRLFGGTGNDSYAFASAFGSDVVDDSDGAGSVKVNDTVLTGGKRKPGESTYRDEATGSSYVLVGSTLLVTKEGSPQITIKNWSKTKNLGITLVEDDDPPPPPAPPRPVDPLVIDLDGDGLELRAADGQVLFDHNADGIRTGTGWASPDDGLLVWDRNANGLIDTGRELFGIDTLKSSGQFASNGFDALADLDGNSNGLPECNEPTITTSGRYNSVPQPEVIYTGHGQVQGADANGNHLLEVGNFVDGTRADRGMTDVWFETVAGSLVPVKGLLAHDLSRDGKIASGAEKFDSREALLCGRTFTRGVRALAPSAVPDDASDEVFNDLEAVFEGRRVWRDTNAFATGITV